MASLQFAEFTWQGKKYSFSNLWALVHERNPEIQYREFYQHAYDLAAKNKFKLDKSDHIYTRYDVQKHQPIISDVEAAEISGSKRYRFHGHDYLLRELVDKYAEIHGYEILPTTLAGRLKKNWTVERAMTEPIHDRKINANEKSFIYHGQRYSRQQAAEVIRDQMHHIIPMRRIINGLDQVQAKADDHSNVDLDKLEQNGVLTFLGKDRNLKYLYRGREWTLSELVVIAKEQFCNELQLATLRSRLLELRWPVERALQEPARQKR